MDVYGHRHDLVGWTSGFTDDPCVKRREGDETDVTVALLAVSLILSVLCMGEMHTESAARKAPSWNTNKGTTFKISNTEASEGTGPTDHMSDRKRQPGAAAWLQREVAAESISGRPQHLGRAFYPLYGFTCFEESGLGAPRFLRMAGSMQRWPDQQRHGGPRPTQGIAVFSASTGQQGDTALGVSLRSRVGSVAPSLRPEERRDWLSGAAREFPPYIRLQTSLPPYTSIRGSNGNNTGRWKGRGGEVFAIMRGLHSRHVTSGLVFCRAVIHRICRCKP